MDMQAVATRQQKFVRISKSRLIDQLKTNRMNHQKDWEKAIEGWRHATAQALEEHAAQCSAKADEVRTSNGTDVEMPYPNFPRQPSNHVAQYDEILERLDFDLDEEIHLTHQDFNRYVRDDWEWKSTFLAVSSAYAQPK